MTQAVSDPGHHIDIEALDGLFIRQDADATDTSDLAPWRDRGQESILERIGPFATAEFRERLSAIISAITRIS